MQWVNNKKYRSLYAYFMGSIQNYKTVYWCSYADIFKNVWLTLSTSSNTWNTEILAKVSYSPLIHLFSGCYALAIDESCGNTDATNCV